MSNKSIDLPPATHPDDFCVLQQVHVAKVPSIIEMTLIEDRV